MAHIETPTFVAMNYASRGYVGDDWNKEFAFANQANNDGILAKANQLLSIANIATNPKETKSMTAPSRRLVQVFIADPNDNIPIDDCLLYKGEQRLTDLTDQELFFEVDIKSLLAAHNEKRIKVVDKTVKERTEYLEPARVRDLKMVVATLATF